MSQQGKLIYNLKDVIQSAEYGFRSFQGKHYVVPTLQCDYTIVIMPYMFDDKTVNPQLYEPVLVQSIDLNPLKNGYSMNMDKLGFQTADFSASNTLSFSYIGTPYVCEYGYYKGTYTSIIHYYYAKRFSETGLLKLKRKNDMLPAVFVINMKTNNIVHLLRDCTFAYPSFTASPNSNSIATYNTMVTYSSYKEFLFDNIDSTKSQINVAYAQGKGDQKKIEML